MDFNEVKGWKDKSNVGRRAKINEVINSKSEKFKNSLDSYDYNEDLDEIKLDFNDGIQLEMPGWFFIEAHEMGQSLKNSFEEELTDKKEIEDKPEEFDMVEHILVKHCDLLDELEKSKNKTKKLKAKLKVLEELLDTYYDS